MSPWAGQQDIARITGLPAADVAAHLERLRNRWQKSVPALLPVRDDLVDILAEHGRILGWRQLAAGLLARRGSELGDSSERLRLAAICVRAAVETEERRDGARMVIRRLPSRGDGTFDARVLVALKETADDGGGPVPGAEELFIYAELLGLEADALSARYPLPGVTEIRLALRDVDTAEHATRLSDTDLVLLAAAASAKTAATPRLELYPRDLAADRALKISQAGSIAEGVFAARTRTPGARPFPRPVRGEPPDRRRYPRPAPRTRLRRHPGLRRQAAPALVQPALGVAHARSAAAGLGLRTRRGAGTRDRYDRPVPQARRLHRAQDVDPRHLVGLRRGRVFGRGDPGERDGLLCDVPPRDRPS